MMVDDSVQVGPAASHGGFISTVVVFQIIKGCATVLRVLGAGGARRDSGVVSDAWCSCWGAVMCRTIAAGSASLLDNPSTSTRTIVFIDITPDPVKSPAPSPPN
eukprot:scaffold21355_cov89-Skeletonema_marinoi.AAC.2